MQPGDRLYSDFFTSGLSNPTPFRQCSCNTAPTSFLQLDSEQQTRSRKRHTIMSHIPNASTSSTKENDDVHVKTHRRASSSNKLFGNVSRRASVWLESDSAKVKGVVADEFVADDWVTLQIQRDHSHRSTPPSDPFSSSPDSTSYFPDFETDSEEFPQSARQDAFFIPISHPSMESPYTLQRTFKARERPTSIHTMPALKLPRSRCSSLHRLSVSISDGPDTSDTVSLCIWREGPLSPSVPLDNDVSENIDWREFHDDLLYGNIET